MHRLVHLLQVTYTVACAPFSILRRLGRVRRVETVEFDPTPLDAETLDELIMFSIRAFLASPKAAEDCRRLRRAGSMSSDLRLRRGSEDVKAETFDVVIDYLLGIEAYEPLMNAIIRANWNLPGDPHVAELVYLFRIKVPIPIYAFRV